MFSLSLYAELNGVTDLRPSDTEENPYYYTFKVQCTSCREDHPNWVSFNRFEQIEIPGSRGEANFVWKCRSCDRTHSASITKEPHAYEAQEKTQTQEIIEMDCRGLEFLEFKPDGEWEAKGAGSNTPFSGIEFVDGESVWFDYDENTGEQVSIEDITWSINRCRTKS